MFRLAGYDGRVWLSGEDRPALVAHVFGEFAVAVDDGEWVADRLEAVEEPWAASAGGEGEGEAAAEDIAKT